MKTLVILLALTISTLVPSICVGGPLQDYAMLSAYSYDKVKEKTGKNDGPEVELWLKYIGLGKGNPYCLAYVVYNYHVAASKLKQKDVLPKYGRCSMLFYYAEKNPLKYKVITPNKIALGIYKLQPGDISIHSRSASGVYNFNGHAALVVRQLSSMQYRSIEANTWSGASGDQGEGEGVAYKTRRIKSSSFPVKGFVRIIKK